MRLQSFNSLCSVSCWPSLSTPSLLTFFTSVIVDLLDLLVCAWWQWAHTTLVIPFHPFHSLSCSTQFLKISATTSHHLYLSFKWEHRTPAESPLVAEAAGPSFPRYPSGHWLSFCTGAAEWTCCRSRVCTVPEEPFPLLSRCSMHFASSPWAVSANSYSGVQAWVRSRTVVLSAHPQGLSARRKSGCHTARGRSWCLKVSWRSAWKSAAGLRCHGSGKCRSAPVPA